MSKDFACHSPLSLIFLVKRNFPGLWASLGSSLSLLMSVDSQNSAAGIFFQPAELEGDKRLLLSDAGCQVTKALCAHVPAVVGHSPWSLSLDAAGE